MTTPVPQELIDMIVDNLRDDHAALIQMSLTSRAFYPRTRTHLFREIELIGDEHAESFVALCREFPHIPPLVVSLSACYCFWFDSVDSGSDIVCPALPSLKHVKVSEASEISFLVPPALSSASQSYISAMFDDVLGFHEILEMIGGSPELQHLALLSVSSSSEILPAQYEDFQKYILFEGHSLRPESFAIESPFEELYDILLSPQSVISFERLRDFAISIINEDDLDFAVTVVEATVNTLQNLRIQVDNYSISFLWPNDLSLSHIRAIDVIAFDPEYMGQHTDGDLDCWMIDIFTRETNLLEKATIRFLTPDLNMDPPSLWDWDDVLTGGLMPSFRLLTIQVVHRHDVLDPSLAGTFRSKVESQFPILQCCGWLNVEFKVGTNINMLNMFSIFS